jgi:hypothetical protein
LLSSTAVLQPGITPPREALATPVRAHHNQRHCQNLSVASKEFSTKSIIFQIAVVPACRKRFPDLHLPFLDDLSAGASEPIDYIGLESFL